MRRLLFVVLCAFCACAYAQQHQIDVAKFTPPQMSGMKWQKLGESQTDAFWYAYATVQGTHYIAIKDAVKGVGNDYSALFVTFADLLCGPRGHYPQALEDAHVDAYDLYGGWPLTSEQSPLGQEMPLVHGSAAALAVIKSCDAIAGTRPAATKRKAEDVILN